MDNLVFEGKPSPMCQVLLFPVTDLGMGLGWWDGGNNLLAAWDMSSSLTKGLKRGSFPFYPWLAVWIVSVVNLKPGRSKSEANTRGLRMAVRKGSLPYRWRHCVSELATLNPLYCVHLNIWDGKCPYLLGYFRVSFFSSWMYTNGTPLTQTLRHNILVVWPKSLFMFCGKTQTNLLANSILNHSPNLGTEIRCRRERCSSLTAEPLQTEIYLCN